jgi:hypothetical protein
MRTKPIITSIIFALTLSSAFLAQAQTLYQVEVIVFSNNNSAAESEETWPQQLSLTYPNNVITLSPETAASTNETSASVTTISSPTETYKHLPLNQKMLSEWRDRLRASGKYRVLAHSSWLQPAIGQAANKSVIITGGNQFGSHFELEGSLQVKGTSPIKVNTNLWLTNFNLNGETDSSKPELPTLPQELLNQTANPATAANSSSLYTVQRVIPHRNEENLLLGKAAYLDNPLIGVLVKVSEYKSTSADAAINPASELSTGSAPIPTSKTTIGAP